MDPFDKTYYAQPIGIHFDTTEIVEILVSVLALCLALSIAFLGIDAMVNSPFLFGAHMIVFLVSVAPGFVLHEIAHKWTAVKYGAQAYYKASIKGLLIMIVISFFGWVFAAPGAVMIRAQYMSNKERAFISMAGPLMNLVICFISLGLFFGVSLAGYADIPLFAGISPFAIGDVFMFSAMINAFLSFFNLLPFFPMDGSKIIVWSKSKWFMLILLSGVILVLINPGYLSMIFMFIILAFIMSTFTRAFLF